MPQLRDLSDYTTNYRFGKSKIFMKELQVNLSLHKDHFIQYFGLETIREVKLRSIARTIQRYVAGWLGRKKYIALRSSALVLQNGILLFKLTYYCKKSERKTHMSFILF